MHFAAHSHHPWPDVTRDAQLEAWNDATFLADQKWDRVFGEMLPRAQAHVARVLNLPNARTVTFAPNTHALVLRILSCLPQGRVVRVLTTDAEFHSFSRQIDRLSEDNLVEVVRVAAEPHATFATRFRSALDQSTFDLVFLSEVFFNSGFVVRDLARLLEGVPRETFVVVDGYHSFNAIPIDFSLLANRAFFLSGAYKYAMSGEGAAFVHAPDGYGERPRDTGWFASFDSLAVKGDTRVAYPAGGARFMGATFDPSGIYRFVSVMDLLEREKLDVSSVHAHAHALQRRFLERLEASGPRVLRDARLVVESSGERGRFLTFEFEGANDAFQKLLAKEIVTDVRGRRLRFGFGLYHAEAELEPAMKRIADVLE